MTLSGFLSVEITHALTKGEGVMASQTALITQMRRSVKIFSVNIGRYVFNQ